MTRLVPDISSYAIVDNGGRDEFNDDDEERRYQEFKRRLMRELVARLRSPHTAMWIEHELADRE